VVLTVFVNRPSYPQHASPVADEDLFNGIDVQSMDAIKTEGSYRYDVFECPNLNISIPTDKKERYPRYDIHSWVIQPVSLAMRIISGGLLTGRNASWFVDGGTFVAKSVKVGNL
jgi:hypothetical protein